ncbi:MAG: Glu/Leu/Phe/Val family dehydrogenase [Vampirovibrionales bacterium]
MMMSNYFELIQQVDHEAVFFVSDKTTGLRAFIALHNTRLGPGLGGIRMKAYPSEQAALEDVLLLSKAMSYKNAMAGLNYGGGKALMILDKPEDKTPERLEALARRIDLLKGSYYGAGDIGSTTDDLRIMKRVTPYFGGLAQEDGGLGDSSTLTGLGVYLGMKAAFKAKTGSDSLAGKTVAVQGAGKVGFHLMSYLVKEGALVKTSDVNSQALQYVKAQLPQVEVVTPHALFETPVDVFSPNAVGGVITEDLAQTLQTQVVAGGANNPLATEQAGVILQHRDILFAPDFIVNAGGVILIASEIEGKTYEQAKAHTETIYDNTLRVLEYAKAHSMLPHKAAIALAEKRIFA